MKTYKINYDKSKELYDSHSHAIKHKECYNNVFNMIYYNGDKFSSGEWKVAYGYYTSIRNLMARHCFIVTIEGEVLDPTVFTQSDPKLSLDKTYATFKEFEGIGEYLDLLSKADGQPALYFELMDLERKIAIPWSEKNGCVLIG